MTDKIEVPRELLAALLQDAAQNIPHSAITRKNYEAARALLREAERRPYNASGSLSEYGVFPECDAPRPAEAYAGCTIWRGNLRVSVTETKVIERLVDADEAFCDLVQRALDNLAAAWEAAQSQGDK